MSCIPTVAPDPNKVAEWVDEILNANYQQFLHKYENEMRKCKPNPYVCKEVPDKNYPGGFRTLTFEVSTQEEVKLAAKAAATGEAGKEQVQDEVWEEHVQPTLQENSSCLSFLPFVRAFAVRGAKQHSDRAVEIGWDKARDRWAAKIGLPNEEDASETQAAAGSDHP